jgi:hypothetical protein
MSPEPALLELLARTAANGGAPVFVSDEELIRWPVEAIAALTSQKLIIRAHPRSSVVCPGCEQECLMPVHVGPSGAPPFIVCDKRNDMNRVVISAVRLKQWRCDVQALVAFVAASLELYCTQRRSADLGVFHVGIASGAKRRQMLSLRIDGNDWSLVAGDRALPLSELITYAEGEYSLDAAQVCDLVDSATTADPHYTPENVRREMRKLETRAKHERWRKEYRQLRRRKPGKSDVWYSLQIAKLPVGSGASPETIRKQMTL